MPQLWPSYYEVGEWIGCNAAEAASYVADQGWARRRCNDGISHANLPATRIQQFIAEPSLETRQSDGLLAALHTIRDASDSDAAGHSNCFSTQADRSSRAGQTGA